MDLLLLRVHDKLPRTLKKLKLVPKLCILERKKHEGKVWSWSFDKKKKRKSNTKFYYELTYCYRQYNVRIPVVTVSWNRYFHKTETLFLPFLKCKNISINSRNVVGDFFLTRRPTVCEVIQKSNTFD